MVLTIKLIITSASKKPHNYIFTSLPIERITNGVVYSALFYYIVSSISLYIYSNIISNFFYILPSAGFISTFINASFHVRDPFPLIL